MYAIVDEQTTGNQGPFRRRPSAVSLLRVLVIVTGILLLTAWYYYHKDYSEYFLDRKGRLKNFTLIKEVEASGSSKVWLTLESTSGLRVECGMLVPEDGPKKFPAVILLGGKVTGKQAVNYAKGISNIVVVAVDYSYEPRQSYTPLQFLSDIPEIRSALLDVVPSVMLLIDYLVTRRDVDSTKLIMLGYSFGAPLVPVIMVSDRRLDVAAMVQGGGELHSLIRHNVSRYEGPITSECIGALGALVLRPLEPLRYADQISPIPLLMINGTEDTLIPRENAQVLYEAAREPKKMVWIESAHVDPGDTRLRERIVEALRRELRGLGVLDESCEVSLEIH
jgi:dienelactone hydrolase